MAIEFTDEQVEQLYNKGFTDEDLEYTIKGDRANGLSDDAIKANILKAIGGESQQSQTQKTKGIDLTPSGIVNNVSGVISDVIVTPLEMVTKKESNPINAYNSVAKRRKDFEQQNRNALTNIRDLGVDLLGYSMLPTAKGGGVANFVKNAVVQGGLPMAAESLKRGGNPVSGAVGGTLLGAATQGLMQGIPYVGRAIGKAPNIAPRLASKISQTEANTISQAVKPTSKALDLTKEQADRLAMDTAERFRNDYNALVSKRGDAVGNLLKELPEDKVFGTEQLLNNYDAILNNYSLSGDAALNPARNATSRELGKIEKLLENRENIQPKQLYDLNKNIDKLMINWDKPGTELKNTVLEDIYRANAKKISDLSPELKKANKSFSDAKDYVGKKSRLRNVLNPNRSLDDATRSLKNYKSTDDSIFELQKLLEKEGNAPYLNDIDDAVAALDLLKKEGTGLGGLAGLVKESTIIPALKAVRAYNRSNLPVALNNMQQKIAPIGEAIAPLARKLLTPLAVKGMAPLQGGISYVEEN